HRERLVELGVAAAGERERAGQQLEGELGLVRVLGFVEGRLVAGGHHGDQLVVIGLDLARLEGLGVGFLRQDGEQLDALDLRDVDESVVQRPHPHGGLLAGPAADRASGLGGCPTGGRTCGLQAGVRPGAGRTDDTALTRAYRGRRAARPTGTGTTARRPPGTARARPRPTAGAWGSCRRPAARCPSWAWAAAPPVPGS